MGFEYTGIVTLIASGFVLCSIIIIASYIFAVKKPDGEKISVYECGFDPYGDSRQKFEVRFFLVGILFIIFDLEISFLFPWSVVLSKISIHGYWFLILFLVILTVGLVYEWMKGGLEWE